jgi:hypothetical protein
VSGELSRYVLLRCCLDRSLEADGQDQFYQDIMAASQSDRPVIIGPTAAKKFYASIGKEPKAKL